MLFKRDWYLVEAMLTLKEEHCSTVLNKDARPINKYVFHDIDAALLYFESQKHFWDSSEYRSTINVWMIPARFKLTVEKYINNDYSKHGGVLLTKYPEFARRMDNHIDAEILKVNSEILRMLEHVYDKIQNSINNELNNIRKEVRDSHGTGDDHLWKIRTELWEIKSILRFGKNSGIYDNIETIEPLDDP